MTFDRVGDEADWLICRGLGESLDQGFEIMTAQIGHDLREFVIIVAPDQVERFRCIRQIGLKLTPPRLATLER